MSAERLEVDRPGVGMVELPWRTERLLLRPIVSDDVEAMLAFRSDPQVQWYCGSPAMTRADVERRVAYNVHRMTPDTTEPGLALAVVDPTDGRMWGDALIGFTPSSAVGRVATSEWEGVIGYTLHHDKQGQGWGGEIADALLRMAFGPLGLRRVRADVFAGNVASERLLRRHGLRLEGRSVQAVLGEDGTWWDDLHLAILREEWLANRHGTE
ncbi:GNAT family N-acetyltransferase [Luteipulveratus flavus]|uniref:GNAT family N-acetyltransferase n=1 Tax=Luteipulveratus flavus TaxID=3031728 RepID=A0ABT6C799_9MICO|nr:GNAT family N-acetyltransferase [Luteipulveratus sp. YIM 133296]MDF8264772.1 GNAT family N-acetyltransferase [Luteipulveratus sp. YIM 133296]